MRGEQELRVSAGSDVENGQHRAGCLGTWAGESARDAAYPKTGTCVWMRRTDVKCASVFEKDLMVDEVFVEVDAVGFVVRELTRLDEADDHA